MVEEFKLCRQAELEASDSYDPWEHDEFFENFDQGNLTDEERDLLPPVVVVTHSASTDCDEIGRLLTSTHPIRVVIINTQAVTVRDDESGEPDPDMGRLAGIQAENSLGYLLLSQRDVYVLQTSVGNPGHLIEGVAEGLRQRRPAVFHIFAPDPQTNGLPPELIIDQARVAYESRAFPLFKLDPDREDAMLSLAGNPDTDRNWTVHEISIKDPAGYEKTIAPSLTLADWAFREARFQSHFKVVPRGHLNDQMKPLADFIELEAAERVGYEPYIDVVDENNAHFLAIVSPALADAAEDRVEFWNYLRELSETIVPEFRPDADTEAAAAGEPPPPPPPPKLDHTVKQRLTETLLHLCGYGQDPDFFGQTLGDFLKKSKQTTGAKDNGDE
jgi:pyruvate-ferredoxin/flavodoxin oxidoreductase